VTPTERSVPATPTFQLIFFIPNHRSAPVYRIFSPREAERAPLRSRTVNPSYLGLFIRFIALSLRLPCFGLFLDLDTIESINPKNFYSVATFSLAVLFFTAVE